MRYRTAHMVLSLCLAAGLAGCSTTKTAGTKTSWWPFASKSKSVTDSTTSLSNAPQPPSFNNQASSTPQQYGMTTAPSYNGGTQYPVTPYPATSQVGYNAGPPSGGYMPPTTPSQPPANQYAAPAAPPQYGAPGAANGANPYVAANPYPQPQAGTYNAQPQDTSAAQYGQSPYPGGPTGGAESPYSYTR
jgi:hypothetical protein